jgi:hypothetical protein
MNLPQTQPPLAGVEDLRTRGIVAAGGPVGATP